MKKILRYQLVKELIGIINIGFLNTESGQLHTYGSSVNNFFLDTVAQFSPRNIYEIGCGAGHSIQYLNQNGWKVTGIPWPTYECGGEYK